MQGGQVVDVIGLAARHFRLTGRNPLPIELRQNNFVLAYFAELHRCQTVANMKYDLALVIQDFNFQSYCKVGSEILKLI